MSNNDKAREKLMESMRATKTGSVSTTGEVDKKDNVKAQQSKPAVKKKKAPVAKKSSGGTQNLRVDPFQTARRVWPD